MGEGKISGMTSVQHQILKPNMDCKTPDCKNGAQKGAPKKGVKKEITTKSNRVHGGQEGKELKGQQRN